MIQEWLSRLVTGIFCCSGSLLFLPFLVLSLLSLSFNPFHTGGLSGIAKELITEFSDSLPGIDEAKSFVEILG